MVLLKLQHHSVPLEVDGGACRTVAVGIGGFVEATASPCDATWAAWGAEAVGIGVAWGGLVGFGGNLLPYLLANMS